jgi:hypothetical protein
MNNTNQDYLDQLSHILTFIPQEYVETMLILYNKLDDKKIEWIITGDLAERLRLVKIDPDFIEIVTSKDGAEQINQAVQEFKPQKVSVQTKQLSRKAVIGCKEFPVYSRSHHFEFMIKDVTVKVEGELQFKVGNWDWGDVFDFEPEYVYVTGKKIAVTPLATLHELYQMLGWVDRAEKIAQIIKPHTSK